MSNFIVRNIRGTSGRLCACGTWIDHWYQHSGSRRSTCSVIGCSNPATVGAHVHELTSKRGGDWSHWIVPMCHRCNMSPDDLPVDIRVALVSANTQAMGCYLPY